jgi:hypothetical protein
LPHDAEDERRREQDAEIGARLEALNVAQRRLDRLAADGKLAPDVFAILRARPLVCSNASRSSGVGATSLMKPGISSEIVSQ